MTSDIPYQSETSVQANGQTLVYDSFGQKNDPVILLIMGLGTQMIAWPDVFCQALAQGGYRVIRFDNRDVGLSTKLQEKPPAAWRLWLCHKLRGNLRIPYALNDMAKDTIGLLDVLNIGDAHVVGASMGGMIAQIMAADFPDRILSLTSMISTSGRRGLPGPGLRVLYQLWQQARCKESEIVERICTTWKMIGSPKYPIDDQIRKERVEFAYLRSYSQSGYQRHLAALVMAKSRVEKLEKINIPSLVIHGKSDILVPVEGGADTAHCIPDADLVLFEGMGHELPEPLLPEFAELIIKNSEAGQRKRQRGKGDLYLMCN